VKPVNQGLNHRWFERFWNFSADSGERSCGSCAHFLVLVAELVDQGFDCLWVIGTDQTEGFCSLRSNCIVIVVEPVDQVLGCYWGTSVD